MDYNSLLGEKRWDILEMISGSPLSPLELSKKLGVTVSYISQQLKFLEIAGLVGSKKTGNSEKGRPRKVYFVKKGFASLGLLGREYSFKKTFELDVYSRVVFNIYSLGGAYHYSMQKFFWNLDGLGKLILAIFFDLKRNRVVLISDSKATLKKADQIVDKYSLNLRVEVVGLESLDKLDASFLRAIYDPDNVYGKIKGGENEKV